MKKITKLVLKNKENNRYYNQNPIMFERLFNLVSNNLHSYTAKLRSRENLDLFLWILEQTPLLQDKKYKLVTKIYWIFNNINELQYCVTEGCHNEVVNVQNISDGYNGQHCSVKCAMNDEVVLQHRRELAEEKYGPGITCFQKTPEFSQKITDILNSFLPEKKASISQSISNAWKEKTEEEIKQIVEKRENTCQEKYQTRVSSQADSVKDAQAETNFLIYGEISPIASKEIRDQVDWEEVEKKRINTKRINNTFNKSQPEDDVYSLLCETFGENDIKRQYKTEKYPYYCDFFIISLDTYIEFQGNWTHGFHPFDKTNHEDMLQLRKFKKKMMKKERQNAKSNYYATAIYVWTELDPRKREVAKSNKLNFLEFWKVEEVVDWLKTIKHL